MGDDEIEEMFPCLFEYWVKPWVRYNINMPTPLCLSVCRLPVTHVL